MRLTERHRAGVVTGACSGFVSGLMGVGGGVIMVPLMVGYMGLTQHTAHGTSLAVMVFTGLASAIAYGWQGSLDMGVVVQLAIGTIIGARFGALLSAHIPAGRLRQGFGLLVVIIGLRMVVPLPMADALVAAGSPAAVAATVVLGLLVGVLSGLMGVGGGIFMVPGMVLLLGMAQQDAQGVSLAVIVPTALSGAFTHNQQGNVSKEVVPWLAIPSVLTALLGSYTAHILPAAILRQLFGLLLLFVGGRIALSSFSKKQGAI
jgi:uncharacterized membrane protein YfcA